ncbi:hypothetical protein DCAR_0312370 [Daucus carota subsp. sativus]|uniref:Uncharacterized protein n=1 Tax=Daucus carota subsp. sativus TaxID=79200 RepID=A0AAF1ARU3_DAUCS|nr:PREDICTED: uncharacterized protein LOC108210470 [Daucus carota subsp. sativus]WOG93089.1 hypothetical protein DCAR_0312370 [Daucus carota subsp. sativus]
MEDTRINKDLPQFTVFLSGFYCWDWVIITALLIFS